jgi:serine/threonine protein phosphatase PrpC
MLNIEYIGKTDKGLIRNNNEDTFVINKDINFCLVADGMGGAAAGEMASLIFAQTADEIFSNGLPGNEQEAIDCVLAHVAQYPEHQGMGCTAETLAFTNSGFVIGHMGDSRTYRFRQGILKQLTKDHSLVQDQIDQGLITSEQARTHSMRNVILRAVGVRPSPALDTLRGPIFQGDLFLLCSDGLTDMVDDGEISRILGSDGDVLNKSDGLIDLAKKSGGKDNITVVLAEVR